MTTLRDLKTRLDWLAGQEKTFVSFEAETGKPGEIKVEIIPNIQRTQSWFMEMQGKVIVHLDNIRPAGVTIKPWWKQQYVLQREKVKPPFTPKKTFRDQFQDFLKED